MLLLLGAIITIIVISFAIDYLCVSEIYPEAFSGIQYGQPLVLRFMNLLYFSIVTFTTVGYGDIIPAIPVAKLITVLEMMSAFVVIVFIISKYFKK
jgi:voltage-gated potassium channel Kch